MKVLIINGSPKGTPSNSFKLSCTFVEGLKSVVEKKEEVTVDELHVVNLNINPCKGCFTCWRGTPGECCQKDDMAMVFEKQKAADVIVWCFPLYVYSVPGILKNLLDRMLPLSYPYMVNRADGYGCGAHPPRYDLRVKKHVVISVCGFYSAEGNYDGVNALFNHRCGLGNFTSIYCGQGELFRFKELVDRTDVYLGYVRKAGQEFADGAISEETKKHLAELLLPRADYERMADVTWGIEKGTGKRISPDRTYTNVICELFNRNAYDKDRVLELHYTDVGTTYQIAITKEGSKIVEGQTATTKVDVPLKLWMAIMQRDVNRAEALEKKMFTVTGEMDMIQDFEKFFLFGVPRG